MDAPHTHDLMPWTAEQRREYNRAYYLAHRDDALIGQLHDVVCGNCSTVFQSKRRDTGRKPRYCCAGCRARACQKRKAIAAS